MAKAIIICDNIGENMIREAEITDYIYIQKLSFEDLGYECDAELVKFRL